MKTSRIVLAILSILSLLIATGAFAAQQGMQWRGSRGWGLGSQYNKMYDSTTVETMSGEVVSVDRFTPREQGMSPGVHMLVKTDKGEIPVHLGPEWYIENQDIKIEPKDQVKVTGSRVTFDGNPAIIAAEVKKGEDTLTLRDANGFPMWSGWRRQ